MAVEIEVYVVQGGEIRVKHSFFGRTESEARAAMDKFSAKFPDALGADSIETTDDDVQMPDPDDFDEEDEED